MILADTIGYAGDAVLIAVYFCLVTGRCGGQGPVYNGGKLYGYASIAINGFVHQAWPLVALGAVFCSLSIVALTNHWRTP